MNHPLRSVLFLPASNARAIDKARGLDCDAVILDLEDAVGPDDKAQARAMAVDTLSVGGFGERLVGVRVNGLDTPWGEADLSALQGTGVQLVVAPKVSSPADVAAVIACLPAGAALWAMIETARGLSDLPAIAASSGLSGLMLGANDLAKELRARRVPGRAPLHYAMGALVAQARAHGLSAIDSVFNDFRDADGFAIEATRGRDFGFDGKSLIHPSQIAPCNLAFSPDETEIAQAQAIVDAFSDPANAGRGVIRVGGVMAERLHLDDALRLLALPRTAPRS